MIKKVFFIILLIIAVYYTLIKDFIYVPGLEKYYSLSYPLTSLLYDMNGNLLYQYYKDENRIYTDYNKVPHIIKKLIFNEEFLSRFVYTFYNDNNLFIKTNKDFYFNFLIKEAYNLKDNLVDNTILCRLRKKIKNEFHTEYSSTHFLDLIYNKIEFSNNIYGLNTFSYFYLGKDVDVLNLNEQVFLLAGINYEKKVNAVYETVLNTRKNQILEFCLDKKFITEKEFYKYYEKPVSINNKLLTLSEKVENLLEIKSGIVHSFIKYYIKDYISSKVKIAGLENNGYHIESYIDMNLLNSIEKELRLYLSLKSNKIMAVYQSSHDKCYFKGFLALPPGKAVIEKIKTLEKEKKYIDRNIKFTIMPLEWPSFLKTYKSAGKELIPINVSTIKICNRSQIY